MKQYSVDLRERLLGAIDAGLSQAEASRLFGVGTRTITRWQQQRRDTGSVVPKSRRGERRGSGKRKLRRCGRKWPSSRTPRGPRTARAGRLGRACAC